MAVYYFDFGDVNRKSKYPAIAVSAYQAGVKLEGLSGKSYDFSQKEGVLYSEVTINADMPSWAKDRGELWRRLDMRQDISTRPKSGMTAYRFCMALPYELTLEQNIMLMRQFVRRHFSRDDFVGDWAIHAPDPRGDERNIHAHLLVALRPIHNNKFSNKAHPSPCRMSNLLRVWRKDWAKVCNFHLKNHGHPITISSRSFKERGINRLSQAPRLALPKISNKVLAALRAKQTPLPLSPIFNISKSMSANGHVHLRGTLQRSALCAISVNHKIFAPRLPPSRKGWPEAAVTAWEVWGSKNKVLFFAIWQELAPEGFSAGRGPEL